MVGKPVGKRRAKEVADELYREYVASGGQLPVNVEQMLERKGIDVVTELVKSDLSGMLIVDEGVTVVVVNASDPIVRRRFTLAHELGHFLLHHNGASVFHRDEKSRSGTDRTEIEANTFAAELLMPDVAVQREAATLPVDLATPDGLKSIQQLADRFGVSAQAMSFRLQNLGVLKLDGYW